MIDENYSPKSINDRYIAYELQHRLQIIYILVFLVAQAFDLVFHILNQLTQETIELNFWVAALSLTEWFFFKIFIVLIIASILYSKGYYDDDFWVLQFCTGFSVLLAVWQVLMWVM